MVMSVMVRPSQLAIETAWTGVFVMLISVTVESLREWRARNYRGQS